MKTQNTLLKDLLALIGIIFFIFIFVGSFLVYLNTGTFGFHWRTLKWILGENISYLLWAIIAMVIAMFGIISYYNRMLAQRKNCQIQYIELSKIAMKWMEYNEVVTTIRASVETKMNDDSKQAVALESIPNEISNRLLDLKSDLTKGFARKYILPFVGKFDPYEAKIILDLFIFLENNGNIPSVASMYENDPEIKTYNSKAVTVSGKTSYQILAEFTLLDHTIRVAETAIAIHEEGSDIGKSTLYGRIIIAALAHDIGKIRVNDDRIRISGEMYHKNPHERISVMMFQEMYPDYPNLKMVTEAIGVHHIYKVDSSFASLLKEADKKSREIEIGKWLVKNKETLSIQGSKQKDEQTETLSVASSLQPIQTLTDTVTATKEIPKAVEALKPLETVAVNPASVTEPVKQAEETVLSVVMSNKSIVSEFEYDFMKAHGDEFIALLYEKINTTEYSSLTKEEKIISVSFGDTVLFDFMFFKKLLLMLSQIKFSKEAMTDLFTQLKDVGVIKMINAEDGFLVSTFIFESSSGKEQVTYVPISCESLGLSPKEVEESKRAHPKLRSINISTYNKNN